MFTHFTLSICFPHFPTRIGNPVFYISIRLSPRGFRNSVKRSVSNHCYLTWTCSKKVKAVQIVY